jgi:hypothetical protein
MGKLARASLLASALALVAASAAAQTTITRAVTAMPGKALRLAVAPSLLKDCSAGPVPEIRILTPPRNGSLITRGGKLKTPSTYRCPNVDTEVQAVFYQANPRYAGPDEVAFEIKASDGSLQRFTIKITVGDRPARPSRDGTVDL